MNKIYFNELDVRYDIARTKQAKINAQLIEIEKNLEEKIIDFDTLEKIKKLYKELNEVNNELINLTQEMINEAEKI